MANPSEVVVPDSPETLWCWPFACILLAIALFPMVPRLSHWWEHNRNKLLTSLVLAGVSCTYYGLRGYGFAGSDPGMSAVGNVLRHAVVADYIPFIILLFSLYAISGGIRLTGDIPAHPFTNCGFLFIGSLLASLIGTTGASMLLIRPILQVNSERRHVKHTVIFFIFLSVTLVARCCLWAIRRCFSVTYEECRFCGP
jgi:Na+/H+ antiporter NhaD/arsenite permease-like protein